MEGASRNTSRDAEIWLQLLISAHRPLLAYIRALLRRSENGTVLSPEDLAQDTYLEAWRQSSRFPDGTRPEVLPWLKRIALHKVRNLVRKEECRRHAPSQVVFVGNLDSALSEIRQSEPSVEAVVFRREEIESIQNALKRLKTCERELITLVYLRDTQVAELAEVLCVSSAALRKRLSRSLEKVRSYLKVDAI